MKRRRQVVLSGIVLMGALASGQPLLAAQLRLLLPLNRTAYQTNEQIDLSVVRSAPEALPAADLTVTLTGDDGSRMVFTFPVAAVAVAGDEARTTEHLHLNGWLLRPGRYSVEVAAYGATATTTIELYSHVRKSSFRLVDWGCRGKGAEQALLGEDSVGFNTLFAMYGGLSADDAIRAGLDYMWGCTMGGGHQMDLRQECDWSDPYVLGGARARVVRQALKDRTNPNCIGVHFYDEPGLTWWKYPQTGEMVPYNLPSQDRSFQSAFGQQPIQHTEVKPDDPESVRRWQEMNRWKESFMDAAWKLSAFGVNYVRPDFLPATQSVYGWYAYGDGYYFNVVRSLPMISGHGGYDDWGPAYYNPAFCFEFGRMRDLQKPNWYLPTWYSNIPSDRFRMEQYMSFMSNLQGMMKPPDLEIHRPSKVPAAAEGIVESNKAMARLGTIFTTMPVTRPEVAVLYSLSQDLYAETRNLKDAYLGGGHTRYKTCLVYLVGKMIQVPLFPIVEEDVVDGTLAAYHKAVVLAGINYLDPKVISALEGFITGGGSVLVSDDCQVQIKGATKLGCPVDISFFETLDRLWEEKKLDERARVYTAANFLKAAEPVAKALQAKCRQLGIKPVFECDNPSIVPSRQALGDIEYLFAVNATYDEGIGGMNALKPGVATVSLPADGRPVYDAMRGGVAPEFAPKGQTLTAQLRFGPGQMRVFARTARPIGGVQVSTPTLFRDYTVAQAPVRLEIAAALTDTQNRVLSGSAPLQVRLTDPLGVTRYDLYRATDQGTLKLSLPLAANDPAGQWKLLVRELLANAEGAATFTYAPPAQCGALAGATHRSVYFGNDRQSIFRFFRAHQDVTIVKGSSDYNSAAAERLVESLKPWNIRCALVNAADVNKPRALSEEEAKTWVGLDFGKANPGRDNPPGKVGFDVPGPVILLGTPQDNPLIEFLHKQGFLPYTPSADFPGRGRGMMAWQLDGVGIGQESVTLIAYDAAGMAEAVGSLYEAMAGLDPLTPLAVPSTASVAAATKAAAQVPEPTVSWQLDLPDRAAAMKSVPSGQVVVLTQDGSLTLVDAAGKTTWQRPVSGGEAWALDTSADGNVIAVGASQHLVCFDGKGKQLSDVPLVSEKPVPAVTFVAVSPDGARVATAGTDGHLTLLAPNGRRAWTVGGVDPKQTDAKPDPYLAGAFSADGKALIALTASQAHVVNLRDGSVGTRAGGLTGKVQPIRLGDSLLLTDGGTKVARFSPAEGKTVSEVVLPADGVVAVAPAGAGVVVGTESDSTARALKGVEGKAEDQTAWTYSLPRRIVKRVIAGGNLIAVAYWGGTLHVLDADGKLKCAQAFGQDIAALAWLDGKLVVGLADGRLVALGVQ